MASSTTTVWTVYRAGFGGALYLGVTTLALSLIDRVGVGPLTMALVGTTLEVAYFLAEVPTGVVADRKGRKPSIVIGMAVIAVGFLLAAAPTLAVVLVGQVFIGAGWTFTSGADIAWLTDEVGEEAARPLYARGARAELLGSIAGLAVGSVLGQVNLWLPLVAAGGVLLVVAGWLALRMHEGDRRQALDERLTVVQTIQRTRASVRARPVVGVLLLVMVAFGFAGEGVDRLWQLHLVGDEAGEARTVFVVAGLLAAGLAIGAVLTTVVERRLGESDGGAAGDEVLARRWVAVANVGVGVSVVLLAVAPWWLAAAGFVVSEAIRHAVYPLMQAWANRDADPATRATLNSLVGQAESVGELGGGPALGGLASATSTGAGIFGAGVVFALSGVLATRGRGARSKAEGDGEGQGGGEQRR